MESDWTGKVAVITGGGTGIGLALAKALAAEGMDIVLASRNTANLEAAAATVREWAPRACRVLRRRRPRPGLRLGRAREG